MTRRKSVAMTVIEAGRLGGLKTMAKHGRAHYERIGKRGGQKVKELIERGKALAGE